MVPDQKPHHFQNLLLSELELERFSFTPAAHLIYFLKFPGNSFLTNVEKYLRKGHMRTACLVKTSNSGVIQLLLKLIEFCPMSPYYASLVLGLKRSP